MQLHRITSILWSIVFNIIGIALNMTITIITLSSESASELYRPSDFRLSAKLMPCQQNSATIKLTESDTKEIGELSYI
jgi:hypothetical protein